MDQLLASDQVTTIDSQSGLPVNEPVEWFIHREPDVEADFIRLQTSSNFQLTLTPEHLIPVFDCDSPPGVSAQAVVFARSVLIGQCVQVWSQSEGSAQLDRVVMATTNRQRGVYSPVTQSGYLLVNGVHVSCYSSLEQQTLQNTLFKWLISLRNYLGGKSPAATSSQTIIPVPAVLKFMHQFASQFLPGSF